MKINARIAQQVRPLAEDQRRSSTLPPGAPSDKAWLLGLVLRSFLRSLLRLWWR